MGERGARAHLYNSPTIFVDNLPHQIRKIWVYNLFSMFGKIRDIFIPFKKSKITGHSFGFVRFNRIEEANLAIVKTNGRWYWDQKLMVNLARFLRKEDNLNPQRCFHNGYPNRSTPSYKNAQFFPKKHQSLKNRPTEKRGIEVWRKKGIVESSKQGEARYKKAEKIEIQNSGFHSIEIHVKPTGNGWLLRSAVAKIRRIMSTQDLENIFTKEGIHNVQVKAMGGRYVIITFSNKDIRDTSIKLNWLSYWFEEISPWNGDQAKDERFVWLACFGMPLNAWSVPTFKEIGSNWGQPLQVDESTLRGTSFEKGRILIVTNQVRKIEGSIDLVVEGLKFPIRVVEEESFRVIEQIRASITPVQDDDKVQNNSVEDDDMEEDRDEVEMNADLDASKMEEADNNSVVVANNLKSDAMSSSSTGIETSVMRSEKVMDSYEGDLKTKEKSTSIQVEVNEENNLIGDRSTGIETSVMGSEKVMDSYEGDLKTKEKSTSIQVEVNEENNLIGDRVFEEQTLTQTAAGDEEPHLDLLEENQNQIQATIKGVKGKKKRKTIDEIMGLSKVNPCNKKGGRSKNKCVVLRSAVAAAALSASISSEGIGNRNRILSKAQAIWEMNKIIGIGYEGDENEVISKIAEMETTRERAVC